MTFFSRRYEGERDRGGRTGVQGWYCNKPWVGLDNKVGTREEEGAGSEGSGSEELVEEELIFIRCGMIRVLIMLFVKDTKQNRRGRLFMV